MIVADTDVLIDFLAGQGEAADQVALELERGDLRTTAVTRFELLAGARSKKQAASVGKLLAALPTLPLDEGSADAAAEVRRALEAHGEGIGMADSLIAGIVRHHGGILLTRNRRHFERVPGLRLATASS
jgi:tRNA(fMet)-specific endonuclease VapC